MRQGVWHWKCQVAGLNLQCRSLRRGSSPSHPPRAPSFLEVKLREQALVYMPCRVVCCLHGGELDRNQGHELPASQGVQTACPWAGWRPRSRGRPGSAQGCRGAPEVLLRSHVVDAAGGGLDAC